MKRLILLLPLLPLLFIHCNETGSAADPLTDYYHEYLIALGEEGMNKVQCVATFYDGEDAFGKASALPAEYAVFLDSLTLPLDKQVYPVYSTELDRKGFAGSHSWQVKKNGQLLLEIPFRFVFFRAEPPEEKNAGNKELVIPVAGLKEGDTLECWFDNMDLENETDRFNYLVSNNTITIPLRDLQRLKQDDYTLRISHIQKKEVLYKNRVAGILDVSYVLRGIPVTIRY